VAAAIDAYVEYADPDAITLLEPLTQDNRRVQVNIESTDEEESVTIADLAADAIDALQEVASIMASEP
jgi:hypothetical protein